ncbi:MAG: hypothetical protein EAZ97_08270 [Bacteroidetes bacterium]|nr:MAG: hypothetical protein EAZ97_08270 [Bacteroidota bacterium]
MKKILFLSCFLCFFSTIYAQTKPSSYILKGKIDGKYEIELYFSDNGDSNVSGYYFYTNMLSPIKLEGKWTAEKSLFLEYKDYVNPKNSEKFVFDKPNLSKEMAGNWSKGNKTLQVNLQDVSKNYPEKNRKILGDGINKIWTKSDIAKDFLVDGLITPFFVNENDNFLLNESHNFQNYFHAESNFRFVAEYNGEGRMDLLEAEFSLLSANVPTILRSVYTKHYHFDRETEEVQENSAASLSVWQLKNNDWINISKEVFSNQKIGTDVANSKDFNFSKEDISSVNTAGDKIIWVSKDKKRTIFEWENGIFLLK